MRWAVTEIDRLRGTETAPSQGTPEEFARNVRELLGNPVKQPHGEPNSLEALEGMLRARLAEVERLRRVERAARSVAQDAEHDEDRATVLVDPYVMAGLDEALWW